MLSAAALAGFRNHVKNTVAYAKYKIGSTYYRSEITDITISSDGKVKIEFILNPSVSGEVKVTEVQLYSTSGEFWWGIQKGRYLLPSNYQHFRRVGRRYAQCTNRHIGKMKS